MASAHISSDPAPTRQSMASAHISSDPAPTRQSMASAHNSSDLALTCQRMASVQDSSDPAPTRQSMVSVQDSSDLAPTRQSMASAQNNFDPTPTCQTMASVQNSSDPAPECQTMALEHGSLSPGRKFHQSPRGIFISQSQYAIELLKKHGMNECVSMSIPMATERLDTDLQGTLTDQTTYRRMIEGLMYLTASHPDIAFATFICARYLARPMDFRFELIVYSDADHAGFKSEYVSLSVCCAQVIWKRTQLLDYGYKYNRIPMYCDSKSAIAISYNLVSHSSTKHIDIWYHFIKEHLEKGTVKLYFVRTEYQLANLFTKALLKECFEYLVHRIENGVTRSKKYYELSATEAIQADCDVKATNIILQGIPQRSMH
nr:hypothetical protein [Tanacetum cinerariifolium]